MSIRTQTPDGYTSSAILGNYLEKHFTQFNIHYFFHSGKQHGITDELMTEILEKDLDLLLVPDAGSSDFKNHKKLYKNDIFVGVIDHHETTHLSEHAVVVNSQLSSDYDNKQFSGVGIVYKFLQALDDFYDLKDADTYLDLVAVGNVADSMEMTEPETRYYVYEGIQNLQNELLKELVFKNIGKWEKVYPHTLSFNLIPKINAIIRVGKPEEKRDLFYAMIGREEMFFNSRTKKDETLVQKATRLSTNAHSRQGKLKKKWLEIIKERIEENNLDNRPILVVTFDESEKFDNELSGVIASSLTNIYRKPVILMTYKEKIESYSGSLRGYEDFTPDLKAFLEDLNIFDWIQGHANAAGCQISKVNLETFGRMQDKMIEQFSQSDNVKDNAIKVDFIISSKNMRGGIVEEVQAYEKYWGKGIEPPVFAITDITADFNDVKVSSGGMIKITVNGVDYTQFTASQELARYAETNNIVTFDAIGTMGVNNFMGKTSYQFVMDNFAIKNVEESMKKKTVFEF